MAGWNFAFKGTPMLQNNFKTEQWLIDNLKDKPKDQLQVGQFVEKEDMEERVRMALALCAGLGQIDGGHHRGWTLDQIARLLSGRNYESLVKTYENEKDGEKEYEWDVGIAP